MRTNARLRVAIDTREMVKNPTGIGRHTAGLISALNEMQGTPCEFSLLSPYAPGSKRDTLMGKHPLRRLSNLLRLMWWKQVSLLRQVSEVKADVLHCPDMFLPRKNAHPGTVVTIHDLIPFLYRREPDSIRSWFMRRWIGHSARTADHIIAVSVSTRDDIVRILNVPETKVTVVYAGVDEGFCATLDDQALQRVRDEFHIPDKYILFVGTLGERRKNVQLLLDTFAQLKRSGTLFGHYLVLVGSLARTEGIRAKIEQTGLEKDVVLTGYVEDRALPALYQAATVTVFPSLYEGFGFPVLEAMTSGCPVIASNRSSLPEIIGDSQPVFDPDQLEQLVEILERVLAKADFRDQLARQAVERAKHFSWARAAQETLDVYVRVSEKM